MRVTVGVDEVGHGAIAGPLVVVAAAFDHGARCPVLKRVRRHDVMVRDSKKVPEGLLEQLGDLIRRSCVGYMIIEKTAAEIDRDGVHSAHMDAIRCAVTRLLERIAFEDPEIYDNYKVIVDGDIVVPKAPFKYIAQAGADDLVWQVSAASILAKERQVQRMLELHAADERYGWSKNKGYATQTHLCALKKHGATPHHRKSYRPVQRAL